MIFYDILHDKNNYIPVVILVNLRCKECVFSDAVEKNIFVKLHHPLLYFIIKNLIVGFY